MAVANLFGGFAYSVGGGAMGFGGEYVEQASQQTAMDSQDEETRQAAEDAGRAAGAAKSMGGMLMFFGIFLLVLGGLEIAAAVLLFMAKNAMFVNVAAVLQIVASAISMGTMSVGIFNSLGIIVAILAFLGARSIGQAASTPQSSGFEQ
jgi:hypothetical protein